MPIQTAREHLAWASQRALEYFDMGQELNAEMSFISDVGKDDSTAWIATHLLTLPILQDGYSRGRDAFEQAMLGFAVGG